MVEVASQVSVAGQLLLTTVCGPNESSGVSQVQFTPRGMNVHSPVITVLSYNGPPASGRGAECPHWRAGDSLPSRVILNKNDAAAKNPNTANSRSPTIRREREGTNCKYTPVRNSDPSNPGLAISRK